MTVLVVGFLVIAGFLYGWHKKISAKYSAIRKWSFVVPNQGAVKETTVTFDEEVQYYSRPNSTIFTISGDHAYAYIRNSRLSQQPDLVMNLENSLQEAQVLNVNEPATEQSTSSASAAEEEQVTPVSVRKNRSNRLSSKKRKHSVYVRPNLAEWSEEHEIEEETQEISHITTQSTDM